jgi:hypothetical protein
MTSNKIRQNRSVTLLARLRPIPLCILVISCLSICHVIPTVHAFTNPRHVSCIRDIRLRNKYDDWRSDAVPLSMFLDEGNVQHCLQLFIDSDYGQQMFGCHKRASDIGITGTLDFVELAGPEVTLSLKGKFWHRRETVLGRAAMWLHACMPEIVQVNVSDMEELKDFEQVKDEITGEVIFTKDKRASDYNGDRATMEYQGMDPDIRGPFPLP